MSDAEGGGHGHDEVHVWEGTDLQEGNAPVPRWYLLVAAILVIFYVAYLSQYLVGAQPSSGTASTTRPPWRRPTSGSPWARGPTSRARARP